MVQIRNTPTIATTTNTGSLIINNVTSDDSGKYICEIYDNFGLVGSAEAYLNIECRCH